jgi:uncharacterized membrane protein
LDTKSLVSSRYVLPMRSRDQIAATLVVVAVAAGAIAWADSTKQAGPILAFIGIIVVAVITAWTTDRRQHRQLEDERERLSTRLEHERSQADLVDLRIVLADALAASNAARQAAINAYIKPELRDQANPAMHEMEMSLDRMRIRLGKKDPIVEAFERMGNAAHALLRATAPGPVQASAELLSLPEIIEWGKAYHRYVDQAQKRVGSRLDST